MPFAFGVPARQSATTRVSNPNGIAAANLFVRLRRRLQQPIDLFVLHLFSFSEIFARCCFIFCRARNARTLMSAALQPVILRISSTLRPCKYSKSIASRSTGFSAPRRCSTSWREANRWSGASSSLELARFSITACSSTLKSACRTSGRHFFRFDLVETSVNRNARDPVLQRHVPRKLRQLLEYFNENHLAEVFLGGSTRPM